MFIHRWGQLMARRRRAVMILWTLLILASLAATPLLMARLGAPDYGVPGSDSAKVQQLLSKHFSGLGAEQDLVVFQTRSGTLDEPANRQAVTHILDAVRGSQHVAAVVGPFDAQAKNQVSQDRTAAFGLVGVDGTTGQLAKRTAAVQKAVRSASSGPVQAWLTGYSPVTNDLTVVENADSERAESIGMPVALIVLLFALGALVAALLPLLLAIAGLCVTFGVITLLSYAMKADSFLVAIVTMIGMGIGIDYALFVVSRFREEMARRHIDRTTPDSSERRAALADCASASLATSGRTVLFSGAIVAISMCSLLVVNSPVFREIGVGVAAVVVCTLLAAWTLLPAVLVALGPRVNKGSLPGRLQPSEVRADGSAADGNWARWAHAVMRRPVLACVLVAAVLALCALPLGSLKYGIDLGINSLAGRPSAQAQQVLTRSFGAGLVSPIEVVITGKSDQPLDAAGQNATATLEEQLTKDGRVGSVDRTVSDNRVLLTVVPSVPVDSTSATALVAHIRHDLAPAAEANGSQIRVGGATAEFADVSHETSSKIPLILLIVLLVTVVFLLFILRSLALPLKAIAMNLLATAASVGITIAVFQWGWASGLLHFRSVGFLQVYIPITVFVMLFGLSMDYEVFLIRRMQEAWRQTGDNVEAIASGVEHTARPIAAAAAIMVAVFGSFVTAGVLELKQFGLALAIAVALDATLVRLVLVPAFMRLLGRWNWWLPGSGFGTDALSDRSEQRTPMREPV
ncbi:MAG: MMPL family transporter [Jatrophihabitantaceae bacterium]